MKEVFVILGQQPSLNSPVLAVDGELFIPTQTKRTSYERKQSVRHLGEVELTTRGHQSLEEANKVLHEALTKMHEEPEPKHCPLTTVSAPVGPKFVFRKDDEPAHYATLTDLCLAHDKRHESYTKHLEQAVEVVLEQALQVTNQMSAALNMIYPEIKDWRTDTDLESKIKLALQGEDDSLLMAAANCKEIKELIAAKSLGEVISELGEVVPPETNGWEIVAGFKVHHLDEEIQKCKDWYQCTGPLVDPQDNYKSEISTPCAPKLTKGNSDYINIFDSLNVNCEFCEPQRHRIALFLTIYSHLFSAKLLGKALNKLKDPEVQLPDIYGRHLREGDIFFTHFSKEHYMKCGWSVDINMATDYFTNPELDIEPKVALGYLRKFDKFIKEQVTEHVTETHVVTKAWPDGELTGSIVNPFVRNFTVDEVNMLLSVVNDYLLTGK